jgi:cobalt-zinc-cadmium efflux system membrane fusion protein
MSNSTQNPAPSPIDAPEGAGTPRQSVNGNGHAPIAIALVHAAPAHRRSYGKLIFGLLCVVAVIAFVAVRGPKRAEADGERAIKTLYHFVAGPERTLPPPLAEPVPVRKFTGQITVTPIQRETIGMRVVPVEAQTDPILLEVPGTTDYDQNTLAKVRPLFDARVTRVYKSTGQTVKKGDPLVELYSTTLAAAKADFRSKYAQWDHDKKLMESRRPLALANQVSNVVWVDIQLAEQTSRVNYYAARDKLITYGIGSQEIDHLLANLDDNSGKKENTSEDVKDISQLIVRAPIDGMIVERDVVSGNFYDDMAVLMVISPMDKLWVWGNVYEKDQGQVHLGQTWEIQFPYLDLTSKGKVEHIDARVDPGTRTLKIRAAIDNPTKELKAGQLVKAVLQIPPVAGQTVIPRNAMAVVNGENCCFIQVADDPDKFERRLLELDQENHDYVVVKRGLVAGQKVVTNGSLILSQLYEDQSTVDSGTPLQ